MYYKLLNKNVITVALVSLMMLGSIDNCDAQGVVSLVEENNIVAPETGNTVAENTNQELPADDFGEFGLEIDAEIPDTLEEDDGIIPLDDEGLISPAPVVAQQEETQVPSEEAVAEPQAPEAKPVEENVVQNEQPVVVAPTNNVVPMANNVTDTAAPQTEDEFDLGLEDSLPTDILPTAPANETAKSPLTVSGPLFGNAPKAAKPQQKEQFASGVLARTNNDLFAQMSDIEKQTTLLTLELRREKIRSEIEAIKAQRTKAEEEKIRAEEERKLQEIEKQKEQEMKILKEQQILAEKEMELEKIRQRKALNAYMNQMLEQNQKWINENAAIYKKLQEVEEDRKEMALDFKSKVDNLKTLSNKLVQRANSAKNNHDRTVASLTAQNIQLKKRIEADAQAAEKIAKNQQANPFDPNSKMSAEDIQAMEEEMAPINIAQEYAIMDITGKGGELIAKLINKDGDSFVARKGTVLHTGHTVEEISPSFIRFNRQGMRDYLYTNGSIEPAKMESINEDNIVHVSPSKTKETKQSSSSGTSMGAMKSLPSLGSGMFVK